VPRVSLRSTVLRDRFCGCLSAAAVRVVPPPCFSFLDPRFGQRGPELLKGFLLVPPSEHVPVPPGEWSLKLWIIFLSCEHAYCFPAAVKIEEDRRSSDSAPRNLASLPF